MVTVPVGRATQLDRSPTATSNAADATAPAPTASMARTSSRQAPSARISLRQARCDRWRTRRIRERVRERVGADATRHSYAVAPGAGSARHGHPAVDHPCGLVVPDHSQQARDRERGGRHRSRASGVRRLHLERVGPAGGMGEIQWPLRPLPQLLKDPPSSRQANDVAPAAVKVADDRARGIAARGLDHPLHHRVRRDDPVAGRARARSYRPRGPSPRTSTSRRPAPRCGAPRGRCMRERRARGLGRSAT